LLAGGTLETHVNGSLISKSQTSTGTSMFMKIEVEIMTRSYNDVDIGAEVFKYA